MKLYHGTNFTSAINICQNGIDFSCSQKYLDFGIGFYTTPSYNYATKTAIRRTEVYNRRYKTNETPFIVCINFLPKADDIIIRRFPYHSEDWAEFVIANRLHEDILNDCHITEHNRDNRYDVVYGEIADGDVVYVSDKINNKEMSFNDVKMSMLLKDSKYMYGMQYSFHTAKALKCISEIKCEQPKNRWR